MTTTINSFVAYTLFGCDNDLYYLMYIHKFYIEADECSVYILFDLENIADV